MKFLQSDLLQENIMCERLEEDGYYLHAEIVYLT